MEDSQHLCPDCGANYVEAVVDDIASGAGADSRLMLASLEEGLAGLDAVPLPALGDTARKMLPALCAAALVFCLLAGVATGANIFYLWPPSRWCRWPCRCLPVCRGNCG